MRNEPIVEDESIYESVSDEDDESVSSEDDMMDNGSNVDDGESEQEGQLTILGSGLDELSERLSTIRAAQHAGNTSLDIINEAHDILRAILKSGKINISTYQRLKNIFED